VDFDSEGVGTKSREVRGKIGTHGASSPMLKLKDGSPDIIIASVAGGVKMLERLIPSGPNTVSFITPS
jgi:hypothetical protein